MNYVNLKDCLPYRGGGVDSDQLKYIRLYKLFP